METLRVGIDLTSLGRYPTGIVRYALEITRHLLQLEVRLSADEIPSIKYVLFFSRSIHPELVPFQKHFEAVISPFKHEMWIKQSWFPAILSSYGLDMIHYPAFPPPYVLSRTPRIMTFHDASPWRYPDTLTWKGGLYFRSLLARAVRPDAWIITVSAFMQWELGQLFGEQHLRRSIVIPEASSNVFRSCISYSLMREDGLPESYFLMVGTVEPRKNVARVIQAYCDLREEHGDRCPALIIAGRKGWRCRELVGIINRLRGTVIWLEDVTDAELVALYRQAICLVFPSLYEGFGLPVLEAMTVGCPVITSRTSAMAEIATGAARLVDPFDYREIYLAMQEIWQDNKRRLRLIEAGYRRAACFSWSKAAEVTRLFYIQVGRKQLHT